MREQFLIAPPEKRGRKMVTVGMMAYALIQAVGIFIAAMWRSFQQ
jgi:hypothetical protein